MNIGSALALRRSWVVLLCVLVSGGVALSIASCVLISDAILLLDACFALFRLLSMTCLLTVLVLARLSRAVSGACGLVFILEDRRGSVAVRAGTGSALRLSPGSALSLRM